MSISPGATIQPFSSSNTWQPFLGRSLPTTAMRPSSISTSNSPSRPAAGSITRPPFSNTFMRRRGSAESTPRQQIQHRHPHGHAVRDLLEDDRAGTVGDFRIDFDAAIHRPRVHHDDVAAGAAQPLGGQAEEREVFAQRRDEMTVHPLLLDTQHHHDVGTFDRLVDGRGRADVEALDCRRHQRRRAAQADVRAHRLQQQDVRAQHAAVQQVADDRNPQPGEPAFVLADGERVEQRLRRMLVHPVAGVDHRRPGQSA